jgi:hypothetical protein
MSVLALFCVGCFFLPTVDLLNKSSEASGVDTVFWKSMLTYGLVTYRCQDRMYLTRRREMMSYSCSLNVRYLRVPIQPSAAEAPRKLRHADLQSTCAHTSPTSACSSNHVSCLQIAV